MTQYATIFIITADSTVSNPVAAQPSNTAPAVPPPPAPQPQPPPVPPNQSVAVPGSTPTMANSTNTVYYGQSVQQPQPQVNYPPAYYYPQPAATAANNQPPSTPQGYPAAAAMYTYSEYTSPPPAGPTPVPTMMHMIDYNNLETGNSVTGVSGVSVGVNAPPGGHHVPPAPHAPSSVPPAVGPTVGHGHPPHHGQQNGVSGGHGVMSPSLTSGFSGSGDCKSTETSSILSAASYSSGALNNSGHSYNYSGGDQYHYSKNNRSSHYYYGQANNNYNHHHGAWNYHHPTTADHVNYHNNNYVSDYHHHHTSPNSTDHSDIVNSESKINSNNSNSIMNENSTTNASSSSSSSTVYCDTCQIAFPSMAVLENHLKGSRHARRVKSQQAFRQLKDAGTLFRIRGSTTPVTDIGMSSGAIRCEVCQVSVNSSHQLQAHLTGAVLLKIDYF